MLDLHRLRILRELHARGTVHAAATALGYSTSAISQQLATLEKDAGVPVLERAGRTLRLTAAGLVLVGHAAELLDRAEAAEAEVRTVGRGALVGVVRVAAFQSAFLSLVAPTVRTIATQHPGIRIEATEAEVEQSVPDLRLHHLDLVLGDEYTHQPRAVHADLTRESLLHERINLVLPAGHPHAETGTGALRDLADLQWAGCQPGTGHYQMHQRVARQLGGFEPDIRYTSDDLLILLELVRTVGAGTLLPDLVLAHGTQGVSVHPIADEGVGREVFLLTRRHRTPALQAVCAAIAAASQA